MAPRHWFTTQNFRVGTLQAARDDSVPATNFGSRIKTESGGTSKGELFCETNGFFSPIAEPLKRQSAKVEGVQSFMILCVKNWMICCILFTRFSFRQPFQLCPRSHGKSPGWRKSRKKETYERNLRLHPLHVLSAAIHLREVSNLLERLGCHRHLRRADSMLRTHYRDLQNNPPQTDTSTNAAPLYHTVYHIQLRPN